MEEEDEVVSSVTEESEDVEDSDDEAASSDIDSDTSIHVLHPPSFTAPHPLLTSSSWALPP